MGEKLRIACLEGDVRDAELIEAALSDLGVGHEFVRIESREAFLSELERGGLDLIIAERFLPFLDGLTALKLTREKYADLPFIFVSTPADEEVAIEAFRNGATDYVPVHHLSQLLPAVRRAVEEAAAGRARRRELEFVARILEASPAGIVVLDRDARITFANPAVARALGLRRDEILGRVCSAPEWSIADYDGEPLPDRELAFRKVLDTGQPVYGVCHTIQWPDGRRVLVRVSAAPLTSESGEIVGVVATLEDATQEIRIRSELRETSRHLEETLAEVHVEQDQVAQIERLRALGEMASGIVHEFNNALTPVLGYSELLLRVPSVLDEKEKVLSYARAINTAARDAAEVVSRLRQFYRRRAEDEVISPCDVNALVRQTISLTAPRWSDEGMGAGRAIRIQTELSQVPPVHGNETELRELLTNLILNAIDAMPQGGTITIRTRAAGAYVVLEVCDTGIGMTEEVRRRCFDPFFTTKGSAGTGMGLPVVHGIVRRHRGTIELETAPGKGTTFRIGLPSGAPGESVGKDTRRLRAARLLRVLVVDDEEPVRATLVQYLLADGHSAEAAADGSEALDKFRRGRFDLVITDLAMPGMSGVHLASRIKQLEPGQPVIMLTGFAETMAVAGEQPPGADLALQKPISLGALREAVGRLFPAESSCECP